ncbi:unnamed protein product [Trifolium pratense]|uniref:Uncharacterized protein n=1 Tax=Trifolium pratense TaxID=57577 RepID=A0ACB0J0Q8_TRIPR|nr:unnamed protein product [Trifolium pratense]
MKKNSKPLQLVIKPLNDNVAKELGSCYSEFHSHPLLRHQMLEDIYIYGDVYLWGWKECVPSGFFFTDLITVAGKQSSSVAEQGSPQSPNTSSGSDSHHDNKKVGEEAGKRRKISFAKQESDSQTSGDDFFIVSPSLVNFGQGVKITSVAVGGRHTLALSDVGQVWGWDYGGEGQLGLDYRVKMVSSPHLIPCIESASGKYKSSFNQGSSAPVQCSNGPGSYVTEIACGGRHSALVTDAGVLLTFGCGVCMGSVDKEIMLII